jgi:hypothetical protein
MNNTKNIYRLVKPYQSNKVYEASSFMYGANKCYRELQKNNVNCDMFSVLNINDNSLYDFNIKDKPNMILQEKNINENKVNEIQELLNNTQIGGNKDDIVELKNKIKLLEDRIKILETKLEIK